MPLALAAVLASACGPAPGTASDADTTRTATAGAAPDRGLLPDLGARPRTVVVYASSARRAMLRNAELVTNLVNGLPPDVGFLVLTNDRGAFTVPRNERPERVRFVTLPFDSPFTIWTQDPFLVLRDGPGGNRLLTSREFGRADDRLMAQAVARAMGWSVRPSRLSFEGGNIVSDSEQVFIGADTVHHNARTLDVPPAEVVLRFEAELGRRVLVVGPSPQPIAHLDMVLTPLGRGRVALGDPAAGARIAERSLGDGAGEVASFERACEERFFGHPSIHEITAVDGPVSPPQVVGRTPAVIAASRAAAQPLDQVAAALEARGLRVDRVPMLVGGPGRGGRQEQPAQAGGRVLGAAYPMLTYNNVLLEHDRDGPVVYLPRYGWPAMDDAARSAWRGLGFTVRAIDGLAVSAMYGGSLRCSVKVLER